MQMHKPLLNPATEAALEKTINNPPHALLLTGPSGMGKQTVATWLASQLLKTNPDALSNHPYVSIIEPETGKTIGIEAVRNLEHTMSLRVPSAADVSRVVIIDQAHTMTTEAQNALLKTLEEPPKASVLILTSPYSASLLPTIRSRVQTIHIAAPAREELAAALPLKGTELQQVLALSGGLPGLAFTLSANDDTHPYVKAAATARSLLQQSTFEKLCQVEALSKDKTHCQYTLQLLIQMARAGLLSGRQEQRWQKVMQAAYDAQTSLNRGGQPKLVLSNLMLNV